MPRRPVVLAFQATVLATLVAGTTAFVALDKTVTLTVDGKEQEVHSFAARTVGDVLEDEGVEVGPHDVVVPAASTSLGDGDRVSVRYGRLLTLEVDGKSRQVWTTAQSVDEALRQIGVRADGAFVSVSRSAAIGREGLALALRTPRQVTVVADGKTRTLSTTQPTVAALLGQAGITLAPTDRVSVPLRSLPSAGQVVTVQRVSNRNVTKTVTIDFDTERRETSELDEGDTDVQTQGRDGRKKVVVRERVVDGKVVHSGELSSTVLTAPVTEVVLVGTRSTYSDSSSSDSSSSSSSSSIPSSGGLNWSALAQCESGGDPSIVSSNGLYHGLYQFSVATWQSMGGSGLPSQASVSEQTLRAQMLYDAAGAGQWPVCGSRL